MSGDRGVSPVVGKTLEVSVVLLYIALLTTTLYGGVVPDYRTAAASDVAERTTVAAAERIQQAVPPNATQVSARYEVSIPETIRGRTFEIRASGNAVTLDHPRPGVDVSVPVAFPGHVVSFSGDWQSDRRSFVVVEGNRSGVDVRLEGGRP